MLAVIAAFPRPLPYSPANKTLLKDFTGITHTLSHLYFGVWDNQNYQKRVGFALHAIRPPVF
jgi:hypothetical protein